MVADEVGLVRGSVALYLDQLIANEVVSRDEGALQQFAEAVHVRHRVASRGPVVLSRVWLEAET